MSAETIAQPSAAVQPHPDARIPRFTRTERAVHWVQATSFLLLLISGFALTLPAVESALGHRDLLREIHLTGAFFLFFGPAIVALSGDRRSVAADVEDVDTWDTDDLRWLIPFPILRLFGVRTPPQGRFNAGQKLNALFVAWSTLTFTITGLILWQNRRFPIDVVQKSNDLHTILAYVALAAFLGHFYLAALNPSTRHSLRAITQGWIRRDWAVAHHAKWVQSARAALPAPRYDGLRTTVQIVLGSLVALFATRVLFFALGANVTDHVTERLYAITAWPGAASIHPQTGVHVFDSFGAGYAVLCLGTWLLIDRLRKLPANHG